MDHPGEAQDPSPADRTIVSMERLQALLAHSWDILSLLDGEGRLIYNSPAAQRLHGFEPEEMEGRNTFDFFHPEDAAQVAEAFQACIATPGRPVRVEYRYARKGGSWIWMEAVAVNLLEDPGIQAIVVNSRDISGRLEAQRALRDSELFADRILDTLRDNLAVLDGSGRILKVNQAWRDFATENGWPEGFRWEGVDYLGTCAQATGLGAEQAKAVARAIQDLLSGERSEFTLEYACNSPTRPRWFQLQVTPFLGHGPARLVMSHQNITNLKLAEEERLHLERQLHRSQKMESLGSLAGGVAHDMNNVLGSVLGMASMQLELLPPESAAHEAFSLIARACQRGAGLVRRLLHFARHDLSETRVIDLNLLVLETFKLMERTTLSRVRCTTELAPEPQFLRGDANAILHALMNLCLNAVDAMPVGGSLVLRTLRPTEGWIELEVEDSGSGMAPDVLEKALDPFFTTKPADKGTGLGLSIVYGTMTAHQGTLDLQSREGQGTKVTLRFPAVEAAPPEGGEPAPPAIGTATRVLDVLLVDDDELIRSTFGPVIRCLGHRVQLAACGEEALELLAGSAAPDAVILDMNMPGLGGRGTLPLLRERHPDLPVFLATGCVDAAALEMSQAFPAVTLIPKPFSMKDLRQHLAAVAGQVP